MRTGQAACCCWPRGNYTFCNRQLSANHALMANRRAGVRINGPLRGYETLRICKIPILNACIAVTVSAALLTTSSPKPQTTRPLATAAKLASSWPRFSRPPGPTTTNHPGLLLSGDLPWRRDWPQYPEVQVTRPHVETFISSLDTFAIDLCGQSFPR